MINEQLLNPKSIVVIGGSNDIQKPGGKILKNLIDGKFQGELYVVNPKLNEVQGICSFRDPKELPQVDLAILAIPAKLCPDATELLAKKKNTRAFIILSAGFSEESEEGAGLEKQIVKIVNSVGGVLIGPNCIGVLNTNYKGVFTTPIPTLNPKGCDLISGSGATAVFIMESGIPKGLTFSNVYSVGNSAQIGVEEILQHLDETFNPETDSRVKLLYIENIDKPKMLLKHSASLIRKGCKIAAIKSGVSEAGSRAASSHTGALASSDVAVDALFQKAGIVRCHGREELVTAAAIFIHPELKGKNIAVITHAGGPAVMLTDALSNNGLEVPHIDNEKADALLKQLFPGSSVANPIDFLATGTAEQLGQIIDACENDFDNIDAMVVIFGSPGLFPVDNVYHLLHEKMKICKKPIYPILPSVINAKEAIEHFLAQGRINFPDEVVFANALTKVHKITTPESEKTKLPDIDKVKIRKVIASTNNGYLTPEATHALLDAVGIIRAKEEVVNAVEDLKNTAKKIGYPLVMKVVGPVHKSEVGGVVLNINDDETAISEFHRLMKIKDTHAVLLSSQHSGTEIFIGAKREDKFGHIVLCGLGGIFIEVLKDVKATLAPVSITEAHKMIRGLKSYSIIKGIRGQKPVDEDLLAETIARVSALVNAAPEIFEMDINPLLGAGNSLVAVDTRIRIEKDETQQQ